jgi:MFS family permease
MTTTATTAPPRTGTRALAAGVVMAITMNAFEAMSVATAMPAVAEDLGGDALYGAAFSAYMLANLISIVAAGEQADRWGPARPFVGALVVFAAGLLVAGLAPTMLVVVVGRALQGAGAGALASVAYVAVGRAWPPERQPHIFALLAAAWVVPSLIAPAAAGFLSEEFSWRWVFLGLLPLLPVLAALALPALTALGAPGRLRAPSRVGRAVVLAVGAGLVVTGLASDRLAVLLALAIAGAVIAVPALVRLLPPGTGRAAPGHPAAVAERLWVGMAFFGTDTFIPLAATRIHGSTTLVAGLVITAASLTWTLGASWSARASGRLDPGVVVRGGFLSIAVGIVCTLPVVWASTPLWTTSLAWTIAGLGIGLVFNTTSVTTMAGAAPGGEGLVASQLQIADALGFALVGGIGGALVGLADRGTVSLSTALAIQFGLSFAAAVLGALLAKRVTPQVRPADLAVS